MTFNSSAGTVTDFDLEGAEFAVPADRFYKLVKTLFDTIELELTPTGTLIVKSGSNKSKLNTAPVKGFPNFLPPSKEDFCDSPNFADALEAVSFVVGSNAAKPELMGVGIHKDHAYSGDGRRAARFRLETPSLGSVTIPSTSVESIIRLGNPSTITTNDLGRPNVIIAEYDQGRTLFITNVFQTNFPFNATDGVLKNASGKLKVEFPKELGDALSRVELMAPKDSFDVIVKAKDGKIYVSLVV